jgi:hypothetical protein
MISKFLLCFFIIGTTLARASSLSVDIGKTNAVFNRFAIPNTYDDRVSLPVDGTLTSYRLTGYLDLDSGNQIYFLIAPLETSYLFDPIKNFEFNNENYLAGFETKVNYKFNSYRLGYLWKWDFSRVNIWSGVVGKIRDAKIEVKQGSTSTSFDNIGFVPLLSFGFEARLFSSLSIFSQADGLSASQGSAYDAQIELRYKLGSISVSLGNRILGGGVDNDNVYNFAEFQTIYTRIGVSF